MLKKKCTGSKKHSYHGALCTLFGAEFVKGSTPFFVKRTVLLEQSRNQERTEPWFLGENKMKAPSFSNNAFFFLPKILRTEVQISIIFPQN